MSASLSALFAKIDLPRARIGHHFGAGAFDDDLAEMQERDAVGEIERRIHVVLDHNYGDVARNGLKEFAHVAALVDRQSGERLVEQEYTRLLSERHGDFDPPLF